ncbi:MAG: hypothetical protein WAU53_12875 [Rhodoplanes sp.]
MKPLPPRYDACEKLGTTVSSLSLVAKIAVILHCVWVGRPMTPEEWAAEFCDGEDKLFCKRD